MIQKIKNIFFEEKKIKFFKITEIKDSINRYIKIFLFFFVKKFIVKKNFEEGLSYLIFKEKNQDFDFFISKISFASKKKTRIFPINKNKNINLFKINIFVENDIYKQKNFLIEFNFIIEKKFKKKYSLNINSKNFKNLKKTKKFIEFQITLDNEIKIDNNDLIYIEVENININQKNKHYVSLILQNNNSNNYKNIFLVVLDGIHSKDLEEYSKKLSNNGLFAEAIQKGNYFSNIVTPSTVTGSSIPSLLTNKNLLQHQIYKYNFFKDPFSEVLSRKISLLSEEFFQEGYYTAAVTNFSRMRPHFMMNRGFCDYINISSGSYYNSPYLENTIDLISETNFNNSFILLHHTGGHSPYEPSVKINKHNLNFDKQFYFSNIKKSEDFLETILRKIKSIHAEKDYILMVTSDHGNSLNNYSMFSDQYHDSRIRVPFLLFSSDEIIKSFTIHKNKIMTSSNLVSNILKSFLKKNFQSYSYNEVENKDNIYWTTISANYNKKNSFIIIGYEKDKKWVFEIEFEKNFKNYFIKDDFKVFKLDNEFYEIENKIEPNSTNIKSIKENLKQFIDKSIKSSYPPSKQYLESLFYS